ncbi:efflux RND transporter periplasmic adaptor subunit, partial [Gemmatimonadota bacterium]
QDVIDTRNEIVALTIRAPINGMVIHVEQGRWTERVKIREGDTVRRGQTIIELPDLTQLLVEIRVNELDAEMIQIGQPAWVRLEAYPRLEIPGRVIDISTLAQTYLGNVKVFPAVIQLDEADPRARPGMTASADIVVEHLDDVIQVPLAAVGVIGGRTYVRLHDTHQPIEVTLGLWNGSMAQVIEGLDAGEEIDLAWLEDPATVLASLAGTRTVPEKTAQAIVTLGDEYGRATVVASAAEMMVPGSTQRTGRGGMGGGEEQTRVVEEAGAAMPGFDPSQITPEMMERMQQGGQRPAGQMTMGAQPDSAALAARIEQLRAKRDALPDELKSELDGFIEGGASDFGSLSPALMDSIRTWGLTGRGSRQRTPPPEGDSENSRRYRS